ncbi:MAG: TerB family tellurite resistance protein [Myxococcota bacterium]
MPHEAAALLDRATLELAFLRHLLGELARADQEVRPEELALIDALCPPDDLRRAGLIDAVGEPTALGVAASVRAIGELPKLLSEPERLAILGRLVALSTVDGHLDREEGSLLVLAMQLLEVPSSVFDAHLDTLTDVGTVELGAPVQIEDPE